MTNAAIIMQEQVNLLEQGKIKAMQIGGNVLPEPIHTFMKWKELGYSVKKGEKAITKLTIWKGITKKNDKEEDETKMFMKTSAFFAFSQVEKIQEKRG